MSAKRTSGKDDRELQAIGSILQALEGLEGESIQRVLDYVFGRLSITRQSRLSPPLGLPSATSSSPEPRHLTRQPSIRDLKEEKRPESSNQMAALVAYYLSEIASDDERKDAINSADLERYFKQASFKLPRAIVQTLANATAAGYFESIGNGQYRLNPVGYNLVVHGLPRDHSTTPPKKKRPQKKSGRR
jgi:hypothetical protein